MSLSGLLPKGLASRGVGTRFGKSISCDDLTAVPSGNKDPIQLYASAPGKTPLVRVLASEAIHSVNLKIRSHSSHDGQCFVSSNSAPFFPEYDESPEHMRFVLSLSDLLYVSVATDSGKEYVCSEFQMPGSRKNVERIAEEDTCEDIDQDGQLVLSLEASQNQHRGASRRSLPEELHLVANRNKSRVYIRKENKGTCVELSVQAAPSLTDCDVWRPVVENDPSHVLLEDGKEHELDDTAFPDIALLENVMEGLATGYMPQLTEDGSGGTYFMSDASGKKAAVFKPMDEEPLAINNPRGMVPSQTGEGLKKGTRVGEGAFREVAAHILDHPRDGESSGFSGVPLTILAKCSSDYFGGIISEEGRAILDDVAAVKLGSLQQFIPALSNCEDMGPQNFPAHEVQKIAILDMRLANTDRNGANILVQKTDGGFILTPIDHGYCLPETLEDCTFEWLYWNQSKLSFDEASLQYIASLDAEADIECLREHGWDVNPAVARTLRVCTLLLKKGAALGLSAFDIGSLMVREDFTRPSALEEMIEDAEAWIDQEGLNEDAFLPKLGEILDMELLNREGLN